MINIYLAGPITGCNDKEANDWRESMIIALDVIEIQGVSPLRCEPILGERYDASQEVDNKFGTPQVIAAKNKLDVARCDLTLAFQPYKVGSYPSIGTQQEIGWAVGMGKPVILVTDDVYVRNNAVIRATVPWRFKYDNGQGFRDAVDVIDGLFAVYA